MRCFSDRRISCPNPDARRGDWSCPVRTFFHLSRPARLLRLIRLRHGKSGWAGTNCVLARGAARAAKSAILDLADDLFVLVPRCAAAVVAAAVPLIARFLDTANSELAAELHSALYWLVLAVPLAMLSSQFTGALEGAEQFAFVNLVNVVTSVTLLALPLLAAFMISPELDVLAAAATAGQLVSLLGLIVGGAVLLPVRRPQFDPQDVRKLLAFGGWTTISNVVGPILLMFDRFLIGRLLNSAAIGVYALPYSVMTRVQSCLLQSTARFFRGSRQAQMRKRQLQA